MTASCSIGLGFVYHALLCNRGDSEVEKKRLHLEHTSRQLELNSDTAAPLAGLLMKLTVDLYLH